MKLEDLKQRPSKILLWGSPGTGKTPFVTSYGEGMQFIDCDDGLQSSRTLKDNWTEHRKKIDVEQCLETDPTKGLAWEKFRSLIQSITTKCNSKTYPFKVLAIDSFTQLSDFCLRQIKYNSGILDTHDPKKQMNQQLWGLGIDEIDRLFAYIKALPIPVVCIFHTKIIDIGTGNDAHNVEAINVFGKNLPDKIVGYFDEVIKVKVRTVQGKMQPYLQTIRDADTVVRSRSGIPDGFLTERGFKEFLSLTGWKES